MIKDALKLLEGETRTTARAEATGLDRSYETMSLIQNTILDSYQYILGVLVILASLLIAVLVFQKT